MIVSLYLFSTSGRIIIYKVKQKIYMNVSVVMGDV